MDWKIAYMREVEECKTVLNKNSMHRGKLKNANCFKWSRKLENY